MSDPQTTVWTLSPAEGVTPAGLVQHDDTRWVLAVTSGPQDLAEHWQTATLADGRPVEIRSRPCGLRCHCAGEFRWISDRA